MTWTTLTFLILAGAIGANIGLRLSRYDSVGQPGRPPGSQCRLEPQTGILAQT